MGEPTQIDDLPSFDRPPVVEVAIGMQFLQLPDLNTVALVRLVDDLWRDKYPHLEEQPALPTFTPLSGHAMALQWPTVTPPVRLWSLSADQSLLVQIQQDRLLLNWRKVRNDDPYPRYRVLRTEFAELWQKFREYVCSHDLGVLEPSIGEVSFFNRIPILDATEVGDFIEPLKRDWALGQQVGLAYQVERDISDTSNSGLQNIALAYRPETGPMQLEISTRVVFDGGPGKITEHLDWAHRIGVLTFDEFTTDNAHATWGRHDATHA